MTTNTTTNRISKKAFAAIMTAKDDMKQIVELGNDLKVTNAYNTAKAVIAIAEKYMADFGDVDPAWSPAKAKAAEAQAKAEVAEN